MVDGGGVGKIPRSKEAAKDMTIGAALVALALVMPNGITDGDFASHLGGIAMGIGLGWLIKSSINYKKAGVKNVTNNG